MEKKLKNKMEQYKQKEWLEEKYKTKSAVKIANETNKHPTTIYYWLKKFKIPIRSIIESHKGEFNGNWLGGIKWKNGYKQILKPKHLRNVGGYVYEHILVAEEKYGRSIEIGEIVHHIDGDRSNNNPDNLYVYKSNSEHKKSEASFFKLKKELLKKNLIVFKNGKYYIS